MEGVKPTVKWEFKPAELVNLILVGISLIGFFYNAHFRIEQLEREVKSIKQSYVRSEVFEAEMEHIKGRLDDILIEVRK
ncbi:MAG: hypothetical protein ACRBF0_10120 [Calditrichia bacterium]